MRSNPRLSPKPRAQPRPPVNNVQIGPTAYRLRFRVTSALFANYDGAPVPFDGDVVFSGLRPDSTAFEVHFPVAELVPVPDTSTVHNYGCSPGGYTWGFSNYGSLPAGSGLSHDSFNGWVEVGWAIGQVSLSGSFTHPDYEHVIYGPNYTHQPYDLRNSETSRYQNYPYCRQEDDARVDLYVAASEGAHVTVTSYAELYPIAQGSTPQRIRATISYPSPTSTRLDGVPARIVLGPEAARLGSLSDAVGNPLTEPVLFDELASSSGPWIHYNPDGAKDPAVAFDPVADSLFAEAATDTVYVNPTPGVINVGSYSYVVVIGVDTLSYGQTAALTITPVYGDGEAVPAPDDFLIDHVYIYPGIERDAAAPTGEAERKREAAEGEAMSLTSQHTLPTIPSEIDECYYFEGPFWNPLEFVVPDTLNGIPVTGVAEGCGNYGFTAIEDVPYGLARSGALQVIANRVFPPPGQSIETGAEAQTRYDGRTIFVGGDGVYLREAWLEAQASADTIAVGEAATFTAQLVDVTGPLDLEPERLFNIWAYYYEDGEGEGVLVNDRTGAVDVEVVEATYADLQAGLVCFVADTSYTPGPPAAALTGENGLRRAARRPDRLRRRDQARTRRGVRPVARLTQQSSAEGQNSLADDLYLEFDIESDDYALYGYVALVVTAGEPVVRLLRQNDTEVTEGYVMVSKVRPDWLLDTTDQQFQSPYIGLSAWPDDGLPGSTPPTQHFDPDTYRFEAVGISDTTDVEFRLEVLRGGASVPVWTDGWENGASEAYASFSTTDEVEPDSSWTLRSRRFVRLVSNARPSEMQAGTTVGCPAPESFGCYDDEVAGLQTVRVELGDTLRVSAWTGSLRLGNSVELSVGDPQGVTEDAVATGRLRFVELAGVAHSVNTDESTRRVSEDWAQAGIRFDLSGLALADTVSNALVLYNPGYDPATGAGHVVPNDGTIRVAVVPELGDTTFVHLDVSRDEDLDIVAQQLANEIGMELPGAFSARHNDGSVRKGIVVAGKGLRTEFVWDVGSTDIRIERHLINFDTLSTDKYQLSLNIMGLNYKDEDDATVDVIALGPGTLSLTNATARSGGDNDSRRYWTPGISNTVLIRSRALNGDDHQQPVTLGHEIGHVLFDEEFAGDNESNHSVDFVNIMSIPFFIIDEQPDGRKRLTPIQQNDARTDSGSATPVPLLNSGTEGTGNRIIHARRGR